LRQSIEGPRKNPQGFQKFRLKSPRGILLYGPPGCSKTTLVRVKNKSNFFFNFQAVASTAQASFFTLNGAAVYSPYLGDAEATVRDTFKKVK
jgi:transitional endoplasmic reticulum ATPase